MSSWVEIIIGVWLIVSPWVLGASGVTLLLWSNTVLGVVLVLKGLWLLYGQEPISKTNGKK